MIPPEFPIPQKVLHQALHHDGYIECSHIHWGSCESRFLVCFLRTFKNMSKYYLPIHIIPFLLFKRKKFKQRPFEELLKALKGYVNSLLFACTTTGVMSILLCYIRRILHKVNGQISLSLGSFLIGPALLFQSPGRQRQIALFLVPKVMQILYNICKRRGLIKPINSFVPLAFGVAMGILCFFYQFSPEIIHPTYYSTLRQAINGSV